MITEELVRLAQVLLEDEQLRAWYLDLERLPSNLRAVAFRDMAERMKSGGEDAAMISAVESLATPKFYDAVRKLLREP